MDIVYDQGHAIINPEAAERQIRGMMAKGHGNRMMQATDAGRGQLRCEWKAPGTENAGRAVCARMCE
jgi:CO/xanthine dehydrogenase Mo-binding subunit